MSEACPLGLNYGHFGEPSYDSENHEWHFPRQPGRIRELTLIGPPVRAFQSPLQAPSAHIQSATERTQNIKDLTHRYPELLPAASLVPGLAQVSEVVDDITSSHDPTVSELLAIGEAVDSGTKGHRGLKTVPIAAVAGGAAGEAVRLVLLSNEKLGWEDSKNIRLSAFSAKGGEEGWWFGNGSPVQQLVFGEAEGRPSSWLAVRYHGAISVLRPQLQRNADMLPLAYGGPYRNPPSRLDANHIVTVLIDQTNNFPFSDVAFNPWYNQQIATIDQNGVWAVWDIDKIEKQAKGRRVWTIRKTRDGGLLDDLPEDETLTPGVVDGGGSVLWAGDPSTILVASRRMFAVFDITGDPRRLIAPNLFSRNISEWILNVKRSSKDLTHVFVTTTFSIFWLQIDISARNNADEEGAVGAKCLLSWRHFRDPGDISLSLQIADGSEKQDIDDERETTIVLLYSRLTRLTNVFTFQYEKSHSPLAPSASDPYLLPLPEIGLDDLGSSANPHVSHRNPTISAVIFKALKYESPQGSIISGLGQIYLENDVTFYQLSLLTNDLALLECLYAEVQTDFEAELCLPNTVSRLEIAKTPSHIVSDFIVPDGYVDREYEVSSHNASAEEESDDQSRAGLALPHWDMWTISFIWLDNEVYSSMTDLSLITDFHEYLELLHKEIEDKVGLELSSMETLLGMVNATFSVLDLDRASGDLVNFLDDVKRLDSENGNDMDDARQVIVSNILTPMLQAGLGFHDTAELSSIYDDLIQTWIVPLSPRIPGRVRVAMEKSLRDMAGQICFASYVVLINCGRNDKEEKDQPADWEARTRFELPMRRRASATSLGKGKERADAVSSPPPALSQMSEDANSMPSAAFAALPTPELTPSLRSQSSVSSLAGSEDPASQRLRAYASLTPQPALPAKLSNLLDQWQVGADPSHYDWEAAEQGTAAADNREDESQTRQRQRAEKQRKRQRESTVGPSSQPTPKRLGGSQPQQGQDTQDVQGSSQQTHGRVTMSQVESGKYGGRHPTNKKPKGKDKPAGFK